MLQRLLLCVLIYLSAITAFGQSLDGPSGAHGALEQAKPWLGVAIDKGDKAVLVKDVLAGTPAEAAGLKKGDQITAVDGNPVAAPEELIRAVQAQGVGNTVTVHYRRGKQEIAQKIRLVARPDQLEMLRAALVGKPAPAFDLTVVKGDLPGKSAALKGKVALVEFWATWCPACRSTHARLSAFSRQHKNIAVVAISDEEDAELKAYARTVNPSFTILQDKTHSTQGPWMVTAIPQLAVVDQQGKVIFATVGAGEYLEEALAQAEKAEMTR